MRFLADMGISRRMCDHLRAAGHDAAHLRDLGLQRLPDAEVFARAITEQRVVLTFDLDFGEIAAHCRGPWASVVVFRLADTTSSHVCARLDVALAAASEALERGAVVVVEEARCRVRLLPLQRPG
jgi:predicted nuclease of predicted toxin-antitoxin system